MASGASNASTFNCDLNSELQRLRDQLLLSWKKEARTLTWLGLSQNRHLKYW